MNDIVLKGSSIKKELFILMITLMVALGINIYSIIAYNTPWSELITSLGFMAILALFFYLLVGVVRLIILGVKKII